MKTLNFILLQASSGDSGVRVLFMFLIGFALALGIFLLIRSIMLWYWKIDVIIRNQEATNQLLIAQNQYLKNLSDKAEKRDI